MWLACGSNGSGALGDGSSDDRDKLVATTLSRKLRVVTSGVHTIAYDAEDCGHTSVIVCGSNEHYQLGAGDSSAQLRCVLSPIAVDLPQRMQICEIALGWAHSVLLADDGSLYVCGSNKDGQLGLPIGSQVNTSCFTKLHLPPMRHVACGGAQTVAVTSDGTNVWAWGKTTAAAKSALRLTPQPPGPARVFTLSDLSSEPVEGETLCSVACGWAFGAALTSQGRVITWGENKDGQCGRPPVSDAVGTDSEKKRSKPPKWCGPGFVELPPLLDETSLPSAWVTQISCGWSHMAVIARGTTAVEGGVAGSSRSTLITWGRCDMGQIGRKVSEEDCAAASSSPQRFDWRPAPLSFDENDETSPTHFSEGGGPAAGFVPASVACGSEHSIVLGACGCVYACGWSEHGNLGLGDRTDRHRLTKVPGVGCAGAHSSSAGGGGGRASRVAAGGAVTFVQLQP